MANFASFPSEVRLKFPANYAIGAQAFRVDTPTTTVTDCHFYGIALPAGCKHGGRWRVYARISCKMQFDGRQDENRKLGQSIFCALARGCYHF